ncbi:hypothetical protein, partial [Escherichia coli]|uniref:hypothetical protein n=1 Tax=Escherichia coli TaxID=562 RepID=UPI001BDB9356
KKTPRDLPPMPPPAVQGEDHLSVRPGRGVVVFSFFRAQWVVFVVFMVIFSAFYVLNNLMYLYIS